MAFKKEKSQDSIAAGLLGMGRMDYDGVDLTSSEVEDLDSCDSDFPDSNEPQRVTELSEEISNQSKAEEAEEVDFELALPVVTLKRSDTFTKETPTVLPEARRTPSSDSDTEAAHDSGMPLYERVDEKESSSSSVRRSGTFTKDRSTLHVQRMRSSSSSEYESYEDAESDDISRSRTFTRTTVSSDHESRRNSADSQTSGNSSDHEEHRDIPTVSGLRRSGTFSKESHLSPGSIPMIDLESSTTVDLHDDSGTSKEMSADTLWLSTECDTEGDLSVNLDLDETLKASDFADLENT